MNPFIHPPLSFFLFSPSITKGSLLPHPKTPQYLSAPIHSPSLVSSVVSGLNPVFTSSVPLTPNLAAVRTPPPPAKSVGTKVTLSPDNPVQAYVTYWNGLPPCPLPPACLFSLVLDHLWACSFSISFDSSFPSTLSLTMGLSTAPYLTFTSYIVLPEPCQPPCVPPGPGPSSRGKAECYRMWGPVLTAVGELLL